MNFYRYRIPHFQKPVDFPFYVTEFKLQSKFLVSYIAKHLHVGFGLVYYNFRLLGYRVNTKTLKLVCLIKAAIFLHNHQFNYIYTPYSKIVFETIFVLLFRVPKFYQLLKNLPSFTRHAYGVQNHALPLRIFLDPYPHIRRHPFGILRGCMLCCRTFDDGEKY